MTDFKILSKCFKCKKRKLYIAKRGINLPIGKIAKSREMFCGKCFKALKTLEIPT